MMAPALAGVDRKRFARQVVKQAASAADRLLPKPTGIVVLIYHRVGAGTGIEVDLDPALFDEQLAMLASATRPVTLGTAVQLLSADGSPDAGPAPVVVTFDDGTADFVDVVLPMLVRHQVPATLYLATAHIDEGLPFPNGGQPLSWAGVREALSTGLVTIGSHTHRHLLLDRLDPAMVDDELDRSIDLIGERAGVVAEHFAYPKAAPPSAAADRAVRSRFRSAALAGTRINRYGRTDVHRLSRSPVQTTDGMRWFIRKTEGGMRLEDTLRRAANRRRYVGVST